MRKRFNKGTGIPGVPFVLLARTVGNHVMYAVAVAVFCDVHFYFHAGGETVFVSNG